MHPPALNDSAVLNQPKAAAPARSRRKRSLAESLESAPGRWLLIFTVVYAVAEVCSASRRIMFFDELMNSYLGDLPSIRQIWPLIGQGIELNPPLPFWITWIIRHAFGSSELLMRLPAIAGFWLMCFCLYHIVRRRSDVLHGFIALLLPLFTYTAWDATYARGYGLMLGASAAAMLCWQLATDGVRRPPALIGLAVAVAVAISCHYYALYVAGALALGEIARTKERRRVDLAIWAALAAGASPLLAYASLVRAASAGASQNFWVSPMPRFLYDSYADLLGLIVMVLLLLQAITLWTARNDGQRPCWLVPAVGRHEVIVCTALAAMPLAVFLAALFFPVPFFSRYVQPVVIGFSVLTALFAYRVGGGNARFRRLAVSLLVWLCFTPWAIYQVAKFLFMEPAGKTRLSHVKLPLQTSLPIVMDSESDFVELYHYGPPEMRSRLVNLLDTAAAIQFRGSDTAQRSIRIAQSFRELHTLSYRDFVARHHEFLVARLRQEGWVVQKLLADGAKIDLVSLDKDRGYFVQDSSVFHVLYPSPGP